MLNFFDFPGFTLVCGPGSFLSLRAKVYGKVQEALAKDEAFAKLYAHTATFAELTGRNIAVGIDL